MIKKTATTKAATLGKNSSNDNDARTSGAVSQRRHTHVCVKQTRFLTHMHTRKRMITAVTTHKSARTAAITASTEGSNGKNDSNENNVKRQEQSTTANTHVCVSRY